MVATLGLLLMVLGITLHWFERNKFCWLSDGVGNIVIDIISIVGGINSNSHCRH